MTFQHLQQSGSAGGGFCLRFVIGSPKTIFSVCGSYLLNAMPSDDQPWVARFRLSPVSLSLASQMLTEQVASIQRVTCWFCLCVSSRLHRDASYGSSVGNCHFRWTTDCEAERRKSRWECGDNRNHFTWHSLFLRWLFRINVIAITFRHCSFYASRCGWRPCVVVDGCWVANWRRC